MHAAADCANSPRNVSTAPAAQILTLCGSSFLKSPSLELRKADGHTNTSPASTNLFKPRRNSP